ncbi:MAG: alpha/beta hydrolase [Bdellovibrionales bacterium]|nr:alpha/beta hydrolase [Bdellovibrionales bacterium]
MNKEVIRLGLQVASWIAPDFTLRRVVDVLQRPRPYPTRVRERVALAQALEFRINFDDQQVTGWSWGTGPRQILLLHGWGGRGIQLRQFIAPLLSQGYRVVLIDFPAHGDSAGERTHLWQWIRAIEATCTHWGPFDGAIAHSFGATALVNAVRRGASVGRLSLVAPLSNLPLGFESWLRDYHVPPPLRRMILDQFSSTVGVEIEELSPQHFALEMKVPLLLVHDIQDPDVPYRQSDQLQQKWYGSRLLTTENLGHHKVLKDPHVINSIVSFVTDSEEEVA